MAKGKKTGGRKAGTPNKVTGLFKDSILESFAELGGVAYLVEQGRANPTGYMTLLGKVLPLQVKQGGDDPQVPTVVHNYHGVTK